MIQPTGDLFCASVDQVRSLTRQEMRQERISHCNLETRMRKDESKQRRHSKPSLFRSSYGIEGRERYKRGKGHSEFTHRIVVVFLTPKNSKRILFAILYAFFLSENDLSCSLTHGNTYFVAFPILILISLAMIQYGCEKFDNIFDIFIQSAFESSFTKIDVHQNFVKKLKF